MNVEFHRRAEIALRSLGAADRRHVDTVVSRMRHVPKQGLWQTLHAVKLESGTDDDLYSIRASDQIRLVASLSGEAVFVQDIVPYERLNHILGQPAA